MSKGYIYILINPAYQYLITNAKFFNLIMPD